MFKTRFTTYASSGEAHLAQFEMIDDMPFVPQRGMRIILPVAGTMRTFVVTNLAFSPIKNLLFIRLSLASLIPANEFEKDPELWTKVVS